MLSRLVWLIGRAGVPCAVGQKGGTLCPVFPVKFAVALQKGPEGSRNILSDILCWCPIFWGAPLGPLGCPGTQVPVQTDEVLAGAFFDAKVLNFYIAV